MYVKKITSFCQVLKRCTQKKIGSFFQPHGVVCLLWTRGLRTSDESAGDTLTCLSTIRWSMRNTHSLRNSSHTASRLFRSVSLTLAISALTSSLCETPRSIQCASCKTFAARQCVENQSGRELMTRSSEIINLRYNLVPVKGSDSPEAEKVIRSPGVVLAMRHRFQWFTYGLTASGREISIPRTPSMSIGHGTLYLQ